MLRRLKGVLYVARLTAKRGRLIRVIK